MSPIDSDAFFSVENGLYPYPEEDEATRRRRWASQQAMANCKIEGFEPSEEFLAEKEKIIRGEITVEESIARTIAKWKAVGAAQQAAAQELQDGKRNL